MKTLFIILVTSAVGVPTLAQPPFRYTIWADGVLNPQFAKSNLYGLGAGGRAEASKPLRHARNELFAQAGYTRFFRKEAFTANIGLVNIGYRYQSRRAFGVSLGVGAQYWSERLRIRFPDATIDETLTSVMPSATLGLSLRVKSRYRFGLENRLLLKPERGRTSLRNAVALSLGYTL